MVFVLSSAGITSLILTIIILIIFSWMDISTRRIPNKVILTAGIIGGLVIVMTGHFEANLLVHLVGMLFVIPLSVYLFQIGAIGGADAKTLWYIVIVSPGIEIGHCWNPILEAIIAAGLQIIIMLALGHLYWIKYEKNSSKSQRPPLIPFLFMGYLVVQLLAIAC
ncbi:MAG: conserved membrane protein of unknown function [Candidatus Thorarchaeota archaeon]|nr:MAG: conserved membrane protein of unknown function [Candidatus Thorarchaeota archaeon]